MVRNKETKSTKVVARALQEREKLSYCFDGHRSSVLQDGEF